jgi:hypothetical protein
MGRGGAGGSANLGDFSLSFPDTCPFIYQGQLYNAGHSATVNSLSLYVFIGLVPEVPAPRQRPTRFSSGPTRTGVRWCTGSRTSASPMTSSSGTWSRSPPTTTPSIRVIGRQCYDHNFPLFLSKWCCSQK